jgi:phosphatidylserine decarboxylase
MHYKPGEFLNALKQESAERNEFMWIGCQELEAPHRRFAVRQISGLLARRIVCPLSPGQTLSRGEKFGMIKLGSRTELILPAGAVEVTVRPGDKVQAGSDVVARWK